MTKFFIDPYMAGSRGAKLLADALGGKRLKAEASAYKYEPDHLLINWGNGECKHKEALNYRIMDVIDKVRFFNRLAGTTCVPPFATTKGAALNLGLPVFCRTKTQACDGAGIVIADEASQIVDAPLFVKAVNKTHEYRVHIARHKDGEVLVLGGAGKFKSTNAAADGPAKDPRIWTGDSTYFGDMQDALNLPKEVVEVVDKAFSFFPELTFAAFDVAYDGVSKVAYVLEANSAPMMTPQTVIRYTRFFNEYAKRVMVQPVETPTPVPAPVVTAPVVKTNHEVIRDKVMKGEITLDELISVYNNHAC